MVNSTDILNARILIVDDLKTNIGILKRTLVSAGHTSVTSTTNPLEVCELHRKHRYDLILLDLLMPGMDGFQVMKELKEIEPDGNLPVIVITAYPEYKMRALQAGAKDFLGEPFDLAEVLVRVHNMLEMRLLHKELNSYNDMLEQRVRDRTAELEDMHRLLRNSELRYREVFENTSDCLFLLDVTEDMRFKLVELNPAEERSVGYSTSEVSGKFVEEILSGESARLVIANYRRCVKAGTMISYEDELDLPSGLRSFSTTLIPVQDASGRIYRIIGISRDTTQRKQIEQVLHDEKAFSDTLIQGLPDIFYLLDRQGDFLRWNSNLAELLGLSPEAMSVANALAFVHEEDRPFITQKLQDAFEIGAAEAEARLILKNGTRRYALTATRIETQHGTNVIGVGVDITEYRRAEKALRESQERLDLALRSANMGVWHWDIDTDKRHYDTQTCHLLGIDPATFTGTAGELFRAIHPDDWEMLKAKMAQTIELDVPYESEFRAVWPDGSIHYIKTRGKLIRNHDGSPSGISGIIWDITERMRSGEALRESQARLGLALRSANMGVWQWDLVANVRHFDDQTCRLLGIDPATFNGTAEELFRAIHPDDRETVRVKLAQTIEQNVPYESEYRAVWPGGSIHYIASRGKLVRDDQNRPLRINGVAFDVSEWKEAQNQIYSLAFYDSLTGLPNRRLLMDRLQHALASSVRNVRAGAILFLDLDNFKTINDTLGHALGDLLLQQAAERLTSCVREEDTVARIGGDEFVVMLENMSYDKKEAATQTESIGVKILAMLSRPYQIASHECRSTCSIGITLFNDRQQQADELLKQADIAMYQAKKAGRNVLRFFDTQMQEIVTARATLESELRNAIETQQFQLYYQIQVDSFLQPIGAEALIRWNHPDRGLVLPGQFIALAEESGLILPIGQWVLATACAQLKAWEQEELTRELVLAVNISAREFRQADFVAQVQATVQRHAIDPKRLKLELTESLLLENIEGTGAIMNALNEIGIQFSLDDFGTGYSSLQYLKRLPIDQIKIDQSFVHDLATDSDDRAIVRTIIAMAKSLNIDVIAEGVETEEQLQVLLSKGCTRYQGYLFGVPIPIEQFETLSRQVKKSQY